MDVLDYRDSVDDGTRTIDFDVVRSDRTTLGLHVYPNGSVEIRAPEKEVRAMEKRWGSCTPSRRVLLNPELIHAAPYSIDYVVVHELCHLKHPYHSDAFYDLLERVLPDWRRRKERLEKIQ